jgi:Domain of unknown function (DUF4112)
MATYSQTGVPEPDTEATRERLSRLAWLLDNSIPLPFFGWRVGWDAILGLIPGIGDAVGVLLSTYILSEASRIGVPKAVLLRMGVNVIVEGLVGLIPFAGDVFDAAWKANQRNVTLLNAYLENPRRTQRSSARFGLAVVLGVIAVLVAIGALGVIVLWALLQVIRG